MMLNRKLTIFVSWSRSPAKEIAQDLKALLENIFTDPNIEIFLSSSTNNGIVAGERFRNKLDNKLMDSNFGVLVLTDNNFEKPWMMFESGALSKNTEHSRLIPVLFNRDTNKMESPISNFQYVLYSTQGFRSLLYAIKLSQFEINSLSDKQKDQLDNSLDRYWPDFKEKVDHHIAHICSPISELSDNVTELMMDENAYENILPRRELQLQDLINNLHNDHSERIILFGGISTILRKEETIRNFVSWLTVNKESKLYICHESADVAIRRAEGLSEDAYSTRVDLREELKRRKVHAFIRMRDTFFQLIGAAPAEKLHFVEISRPLTNYTTIQGSTIYLTPVLNKRASNTFTFKLKKSYLCLQVIEYITSRLDHDDSESEILLAELETLRQEVNAYEGKTVQ